MIAKKQRYTLIIQCKKYGKPVGNKAVQEAIAAKLFYNATHAAVVSNQKYTKSAERLAIQANVFLFHFTDLKYIDKYVFN